MIKLSDLLRAGLLTPVYHGESGVRTLRELSRSYLAVSKDLTRVMNRQDADSDVPILKQVKVEYAKLQ